MNKEETSDRIKKALEIRDMKQVDLVEKTGIDKGQLSSYISGKYKPKQRNLHLIATALSVDEAWLMGYDVPMERQSDKTETEATAPTLNSRDERDIKHDLESLREKLINKELGPAAYDGEDIPEDDTDLFLGQVDLMLRRLKAINKEKYNPHKNKK